MTTTSLAHPTYCSRSIQADLAFWTVAGAIGAALSGPVSASWGVPSAVPLGGGIAFAILGPALLVILSRIRITRGLVAAFVVTNLVLAPLACATAAFGWLPLTGAGNWALVDAGVVMLALGVWQFGALRAARS
ncbi:hypothetical protein PT015_03490 [Candidatus Mycobacterium wuenschmannii]|uniref:Integral membrane protein n=1 Tax=Candidatus Mycobacterium wuenschmannii TaxID=3027808 RepID=A0ABY8VZP9_9MYCO|nr:hypothetical protein [Candidatus Mycobacterium wuenschmannii]WIM88571.1 hypothetical protein PT015_03490 [Candidatus Mycobacterium wuenschmannii]